MPETPDGRAVSTTELTASTAAERNALTHLAADARMLSHHKHPNFVPIVEARWMAANRLAIIRARVRGSTLRQALDAVGPMPEARTIEVLTDVGGVLDWAARGNVVHRTVTSDCVCFQKGSGRVMVSFGLPASLDATPAHTGEDGSGFLFERCADGATLARLAYEMLTTHRASDASVESLKAVRPDVSAEMVAAIEAGLSCATGGPAMTAPQFLAMLPAATESRDVGAAAVATAASAPVVPRAARTPVVAPVMPLSGPAVGARVDPAATIPAEPVRAATPDASAPAGAAAVPPSVQDGAPAYAAPRRRRGRGLLIASMLGLVLLVGTTFALIQSERGRDEARVAANQRDDESAGDIDVALTDTLAPDPDAMTADGAEEPGTRQGGTSAPVGGDAVTRGSPGTASVPSSLPSNRTQPLPRSLPRSTADASSAPSPRSATTPASGTGTPRVAAATPRATGSACDSPSMSSQRTCLSAMIEVSDRELTSVYQALLRAVRERSGADAEEHVRVQQRAWLVKRDAACRTPAARDGELWARERAACLARESDARALQLARALAAIRS